MKMVYGLEAHDFTDLWHEKLKAHLAGTREWAFTEIFAWLDATSGATQLFWFTWAAAASASQCSRRSSCTAPTRTRVARFGSSGAHCNELPLRKLERGDRLAIARARRVRGWSSLTLPRKTISRPELSESTTSAQR